MAASPIPTELVNKPSRSKSSKGRFSEQTPATSSGDGANVHFSAGSSKQLAADSAHRVELPREPAEGRDASKEPLVIGRDEPAKEPSLTGQQSSAATTAQEAGTPAGQTPTTAVLSEGGTIAGQSRGPFDAAALQSCAVQPSENCAMDDLTDQGDPLESRDVMVGSSQLAPGVSISNWRRWDSSPEASRKQNGMVMDDSAREVDSPVEPETLEKLWPLMAAVQRRQTTGSSAKLAATHSASFKAPKDRSQKKLHTDRSYGSRSEHLTRAQAEFLAQHARTSAPHKGSSSKGHGLFMRQGASLPGTGRLQSDRYDSLRSLDPRKERRMDSQERVWLWLEQAEEALMEVPPAEKQQRVDSKPISRKQSAKIASLSANLGRKAEPVKPPRNALQRMFSCFAS